METLRIELTLHYHDSNLRALCIWISMRISCMSCPCSNLYLTYLIQPADEYKCYKIMVPFEKLKELRQQFASDCKTLDMHVISHKHTARCTICSYYTTMSLSCWTAGENGSNLA